MPLPVDTYPKKPNRKIEHKPVYQKEQASASMKAERHYRDKGGRPISLNSSERIPLERTETGEDIEITVKSGVIRIAASQSKHAEDITLAFTCRSDVFKFHYPENLELSIEAITDTTCTVV